MKSYASKSNRSQPRSSLGGPSRSAPWAALTPRVAPTLGSTQPQRELSDPGDAYEREASEVAERVLRMPDSADPVRTQQRPLAISRKCSACEEDDKPLQRAASEHEPSLDKQGSLGVEAARTVARQAGEPLPAATRDFFEPRFGHDFSRVRVHTDSEAAAAARGVRARAFTLGQHIVFGRAEYAPATAHGKLLLAHELTHVVQQGASGAASTGVVQRKIAVEPTDDATDPAHNMPVEEQRNIVGALVHDLCPDFEVPPSSPLRVESRGGGCADIQNATRPPHAGCCCLCVLTRSGQQWRIVISQNESPNTSESGHTVTINPSDSPVESMHWTGAGGAGERMVHRPRIITFGHELCGHAALMEIGSHPDGADRRSSDVHDPTIKIERQIWREQGLPAADRRGLAGEGTHRGESVYRVRLDHFPVNISEVARLPANKLAELRELKRFSSERTWFIEVHGHSDHAGTPEVRQEVSDRRATAVRDDLATAPNASNYRFVTVAGHSDSQPLPGASPAELRRAEVVLSLFRAGVPTSPPASPVDHVAPADPTQNAANQLSADPCIRHLATEAWR
jgi:hypothetical protein